MTTVLETPTFTLRAATAADLDRLVEMGRHFLQTTAYQDRIVDDPEHVRQTAMTILAMGRIIGAEQAGALIGMIWVVVVPHLLLSLSVGSEIVWWVEPDARRTGAGRALFRASEAWARGQGAAKMQFTAYRDPVLERFYRSLGYLNKESIWEKDL